jgi:hypothetical protein
MSISIATARALGNALFAKARLAWRLVESQPNLSRS